MGQCYLHFYSAAYPRSRKQIAPVIQFPGATALGRAGSGMLSLQAPAARSVQQLRQYTNAMIRRLVTCRNTPGVYQS